MFDMLKTIILDVLGVRAAPMPMGAHAAHTGAYAQPPTHSQEHMTPHGYPVFDSTDMLTVGENRSGIL